MFVPDATYSHSHSHPINPIKFLHQISVSCRKTIPHLIIRQGERVTEWLSHSAVSKRSRDPGSNPGAAESMVSRKHGQEGAPAPSGNVLKCFCALVVTAKRQADELFMHYFHCLSSSAGALPPCRPPPELNRCIPLWDFRSQTPKSVDYTKSYRLLDLHIYV